MSYVYQSALADEFKSFLQMIENAGQQPRGYAVTFKSLDIFLTGIPHNGKSLPEQLIMEWLGSMTCKPQSKNREITHIRVFPVLLRILYGCGLRLGEALALRWEDISLETGILHIKHAKNDKDREVPMDPSLTAVLSGYKKRQFAENPDAGYLFESDRIPGTPFPGWTFRRWFLDIAEQAGIINDRTEKYERGISPHTLRHYFAYKSFLQSEEKGKTLEQFVPYLSAYLGHRSLLETEKYLTTDYTLYQDSQKRMKNAVNHIFPEVDFE